MAVGAHFEIFAGGPEFEVTPLTLQGCVLSPMLFNIFLEMVIALAGEDMEIGAVINGVRIGNLRFADDIAALAENEADLQISVGRIAEVSKKNEDAD